MFASRAKFLMSVGLLAVMACDREDVVMPPPAEPPECEAGEACEEGWDPVLEPPLPCVATTEVCDGRDNDCDGVIDEDVCERTPACVPEAEVCNGRDDDCDEVVDEGCRCVHGQTVLGVCFEGRRDALGVCRASEAFEAEETLCDGLDNDCDGEVDEGCPCDYMGSSVGVCAMGRRWRGMCLTPWSYAPEEADLPDGEDNDCDGEVDEKSSCLFGGMSVGVCHEGRLRSDGRCEVPASYQEDETLCDGLDNDCDGVVDEGCARYKAVYVEGERTCGLREEGSLWCWGWRGLDAREKRGAPERLNPRLVRTPSGHRVQSLIMGGGHDCMRTRDKQNESKWLCVGRNDQGQLGQGDRANMFEEVVYMPLLSYTTGLSIGAMHTCRIHLLGETLTCWGDNDRGQLGFGDTVDRLRLPGDAILKEVTSVKLSAWRSCAVREPSVSHDGELWCWGDGSSRALGDGSASLEDRLSPVHVIDTSGQPLLDVKDFTLAPTHACAVRGHDEVWCWGENTSGEVGEDPASSAHVTVATRVPLEGGLVTGGALDLVPTPRFECSDSQTTFDVVTCRRRVHHQCAHHQTMEGAQTFVTCWGDNSFGQLGDGTTASRHVQRKVTGSLGFHDAVGSVTAHCAITDTAQVACWGELAGTRHLTPTVIAGVSEVRQLVAGTTHFCALTQRGEIWCWGENEAGQLGDGTTASRATARPIEEL